MSDLNNKKNVNNDEIDLLDLLRRLGRSINKMFNWIGKGCLISIVFIIRNFLPLALSILLGVGIAYSLKTARKSSFTSDLILKTNTIPASEMIPYLNRLHTFCQDDNKNSLEKAISVTSEQTDNIIDISAFYVIDKFNDGIPDETDYSDSHNIYDTVNVRMEDRVDIRVRIVNPEELSDVRDGIINFIKSDSLFQQKNRLILKQHAELLSRLDYDIMQLDSLQKVKYFEETRNRLPRTGGQMIFLQQQNTQLVYTDIYKLYEQKQELELDQKLYKDIVTILSDFSVASKRENGLSYYVKETVPICFIITLLVLILVSNRKKLLAVYKKY